MPRSKFKKTEKIGFQGWYLSQEYTGIGQHCIGLLRAMAKTKNRPEIIIPVPSRVSIKGVPAKWIKVIKPKWWLPVDGLKKWYWERVQVPDFFAKENPDWEHYPYPCPLPEYSPNLRSVTVHDLIPWEDDRYKAGPIKNYYHKLARHSLVYVDHVFTVSKSTHEELGIPAATILPNAIPDMPKGLKKMSYENTLVYLGGYAIHKRVPDLIKSFKRVRKTNPEMNLVMIGKPHHKSKYYPELPKAEGVSMLGAITDKRVYSILKSSFAFVHFSDSEGFNIPLLQAMSAGTPAIVADIPVNREVSAGASLYMKVGKGSRITALSDKIKKLKSKSKRKSIIDKQKVAARRYSWEKSAKIFLKELRYGEERK